VQYNLRKRIEAMIMFTSEDNINSSDCETDCAKEGVDSELVRWMTEGTDPRLAPRSDCG
tara:strand:- start:15472 stop:15648 length:177 start_codon:yes stop_codon:yes gene_type:complete